MILVCCDLGDMLAEVAPMTPIQAEAQAEAPALELLQASSSEVQEQELSSFSQ